MSAITLVDAETISPAARNAPSSGDAATTGSSTALDVSYAARVMLDVALTVPDVTEQPIFDLTIESGPTDAGPWSTVAERKLADGVTVKLTDRLSLVGFDDFIRASWSAKAIGAGSGDNVACSALTLTITGATTPDEPAPE